jgi:hypothetical protein
MDLVDVLHIIEKTEDEAKGYPNPLRVDPQEFGVTVIAPDDEEFIPAIQAAITTHYPQARVCIATFPADKKGDKLRLLLAALLTAVGRPAPTRGEPTDDLMLKVPLVMVQETDFLIVDRAEYLNHPCLHFLRRDRGMAPALLVGRHRRFFETLAKDPTLNRRAVVVDSPILSG